MYNGISILGVEMDLGKTKRGAYCAPQAIREGGLLNILNSSVKNLKDCGNLSIEVSDKLNLDNNLKFNIKDIVPDLERISAALKQLHSRFDGIHLSFDLDSITPEDAPGVGTPCPVGLSYKECITALSILKHSKLITSAEFVELNPFFDVDDKTVKITIELIKTLLSFNYFIRF